MHVVKLFLFCLACCVTQTLWPTMPLTNLKGLDAIVDKNFQHLSLVHGALWWENKLIESIYKNREKNDIITQLVRDIFYLQPDLITFDVTTLKRSPANYFTPTTIGKILAIIEPYSHISMLSQEVKDELHHKLFDAIAEDINFEELQKRAAQNTKKILEDAQKESTNFKHYQELENISKKTDALRNKLKIVTKQEFAKISKKLSHKLEQQKKLTKEYGSLKQLLKQKDVKKILGQLFLEDFSKKNLDTLVHHIVEGLAHNLEKNYQHCPFIVQYIFLGFLWKLVEDKNDLVPFIQAFKENYLGDNTAFNEDNFNTYLQEKPYTREDFTQLQEKYKTGITINDISNNYEEVVFYLFAFNIWNNVLPPIASSISKASYEGITISDCVDNSIRNFINILIFNPTQFVFDIQKSSFSPSTIDFYKKYSNPLNAQLIALHNEWLKVVSRLPGVAYLKPPKNPFCELDVGLTNVMKVFNYCLFNNSESFNNLSNSKKLDFLCNQARFLNLSWSSNISVDKSTADQEITITFLHNKKSIFEWVFQPLHSYINSLLKIDFDVELVVDKYNTHPSHYNDIINNTKIMMIASFILKKMQGYLLSLAKEEKTKEIAQQIVEFLFFIMDYEQRTALIEKIIRNRVTNLYGFVQQVVHQYPSMTYRILTLVLDYKVRPLYVIIEPSIKLLLQNEKENIVQSIIKNSISELYPFVANKYELTPKEQIFPLLLTTISSNNEYFFPLFEKKSQFVSQTRLFKLIKKIIKKNRTALFHFVEKQSEKLSQENSKKLKKILNAQILLNQIALLQKKIQKDFNVLFKNPTQESLNVLKADYATFRNTQEQFLQKLPKTNEEILSLELYILKRAKKIVKKMFRKLANKFENADKTLLKQTLEQKTIKDIYKNFVQQKKYLLSLLNKKIALVE